MLGETGRVYHITDAGAKALQAERSVPAWYRAVLAQITARDCALSRAIRQHPPHRIRAWLEEMETLGFIRSVAGESRLAKYARYKERLPELQPIIDKLEALSAIGEAS